MKKRKASRQKGVNVLIGKALNRWKNAAGAAGYEKHKKTDLRLGQLAGTGIRGSVRNPKFKSFFLKNILK
ncbi:MAG: hypothetical protein IPL65_16420 [Lewinellaceae bacterium]|nr:hypothetical protein [Lewinellaceae bacterium]